MDSSTGDDVRRTHVACCRVYRSIRREHGIRRQCLSDLDRYMNEEFDGPLCLMGELHYLIVSG